MALPLHFYTVRMKQWLKCGAAASVITVMVMLMALYALSRGYIGGNLDSPSIFKPFSSLFGKNTEKGENHSVSQKTEPRRESPPHKRKPKEESPKEKSIVPKELTITESNFEGSKRESQDKIESQPSNTSILIGVQQIDNERKLSKESKREMILPSFDTLFIPIYSAENLTNHTLKQFQNAFPSADPRRKRFVIEREAPSTGYEISVYDDQQFLSTFVTEEDFPFQGLPQISKVEGGPLESHSRFLVFSDTSENTNEVLNTESHLNALLKSAYRSNLDPQMRIGKDPQFGVEIYMLFPGIFIADHLR